MKTKPMRSSLTGATSPASAGRRLDGNDEGERLAPESLAHQQDVPTADAAASAPPLEMAGGSPSKRSKENQD